MQREQKKGNFGATIKKQDAKVDSHSVLVGNNIGF